ncbi:NUDIX hydrolase [Aurantiacibacter sediminis]|uniref:NUDIX domain-containing protein n=1 Tax=Aurantiacibacter sediminis TaxID=2793064 RepID=A0ABS0N1L0_9SPHN|nr:NUDIX domain-containing protein [Aurantiacibacter sediminis]MBH5321841.1 NUDIX domain-containing protein [Aurantiacibacter sediminis]
MPLANRVRNFWQHYASVDVYGVALIGFDAESQLLLVRHSYGARKWAMPAGGIKRGEDPEDGIRREIREELSVELTELELVKEREEQVPGQDRKHHVWVFTARVLQTPKPDMREVVNARFFSLDDLPEPLEKRVRPRLEMLQAKRA